MPIDHDHLARQTFGDADLTRELLDLFAQQCRRLLPGIADGARGPAERADLAHTLRGSALGIGAWEVADRAAAIEDALRRGRMPDRALPDLDSAVAAALAEIAAET